MEPMLYLVKMWAAEEEGDLGSVTEIKVQLTDINGHYFADFHQGSWAYAHHALLKGLQERGRRFIGSLPNLDPARPADEKSFWVITEPLELARRDTHRRDHDGY